MTVALPDHTLRETGRTKRPSVIVWLPLSSVANRSREYTWCHISYGSQATPLNAGRLRAELVGHRPFRPAVHETCGRFGYAVLASSAGACHVVGFDRADCR